MKKLFIVHTYYDHRKNKNIYILNIHWKDWCWSWNPNTLATWCEELTHWKRPWCWERLKAGGEGDDRGWDGGMASPTWWTCVWVNSGSQWWTGRPGMLQSMGLQRVGHDWQLNWTEHFILTIICMLNEIIELKICKHFIRYSNLIICNLLFSN